MDKKKNTKELKLDDDAVFVSSEGIRYIEQAISSLEQAQEELKKAAEGKKSTKRIDEDKNKKSSNI